jgi:hypothetical protein
MLERSKQACAWNVRFSGNPGRQKPWVLTETCPRIPRAKPGWIAPYTTQVPDWKDRYRGRLTREQIQSRMLAGDRELLVWLPQSYGCESQDRLPIIVIHDGANVFDPSRSPLSGMDWAADEWVNLLSRRGVMPEAIVVAVCHGTDGDEVNGSNPFP